ncbi:hypothetical protein KHO57_gp138 [Mycobacterium phage Phabba]|uniref:Uncharacterized protein n=1 Tax=Mycobacterium phage Phabba TaxID=2027899 RepID=A0A249XST8_9CAUD|nr:hypothetical protein KHO57_gp138 [Mycobacterium phage Phabba]ASZ74766.1 hypothetical protein SEA_PHABBA_229 [Mycobacterium phage Phabba]
MPVKNEEWTVPDTGSLKGGDRFNYLTSNPTPAEACERIAAALGGTLLVRTADLDLKALRETGILPEKIAYAVDVTRFYDEISTTDDGRGGRRPKGTGSGSLAEPTWAELDDWYEAEGTVYNQRNKIDNAKWKAEEAREQLIAKFRSVLPGEESDKTRLDRIASALGLEVREPVETPETGVEAVKSLWGLTLKSTAIVASKLASEGKAVAKEKWAKARRT